MTESSNSYANTTLKRRGPGHCSGWGLCPCRDEKHLTCDRGKGAWRPTTLSGTIDGLKLPSRPFPTESSPAPDYFNLSATLVNAALAHAASLSPPGAPLTATAPMTWSPTLIGTPPIALIVPGTTGAGTGAPAGKFGGGPDGRPKAITLLAFIVAT